MTSVGGVLIFLFLGRDPADGLTTEVCDAWPVRCQTRTMVSIPAAGHHRPLTGTTFYCLVTEAHVCKQLARKAEQPGL